MNFNNGEHLAFCRAMATDGERSPAQTPEQIERKALDSMLEDSGIRRVEALMDGEYRRRVHALTPQHIAEMSPHEIAAMDRWIERNIKLLSTQLCLLRRNAKKEPEVPAIYKLKVQA